MLMKKMHAKRLLKLARFLDALPRNEFDISHWFNNEKREDCGSASCALGWACTIPSFRRAGLKGGTSGDYLGKVPVFFPASAGERSACRDRKNSSPEFFYRYGRNYAGFMAGSYFFGISNEESQHLFQASSYDECTEDPPKAVTPKRVAKRIRSLVKKYYPELVKKGEKSWR